MKSGVSKPAPPVATAADGEVVALARGLLLLRTLADAGRPLGNTELSTATGIPKATVSRLAATLVAAGHLRQEADSERYWLGPALLDLGNRYLSRFDLRQLVRRHFAPIAEATGASMHLGIRDGADLLVIESVRPRSAVITSQIDVGSRMALVSSAGGRAYLAAAPAHERAAVLAHLGLEPGARRKVEERLAAAAKAHATLGYTCSFGEWNPQINALGMALTGPRGEVYALSCGGPAQLLQEAYLTTEVAPRLLLASDALHLEAGVARRLRSEAADRTP